MAGPSTISCLQEGSRPSHTIHTSCHMVYISPVHMGGCQWAAVGSRRRLSSVQANSRVSGSSRALRRDQGCALLSGSSWALRRDQGCALLPRPCRQRCFSDATTCASCAHGGGSSVDLPGCPVARHPRLNCCCRGSPCPDHCRISSGIVSGLGLGPSAQYLLSLDAYTLPSSHGGPPWFALKSTLHCQPSSFLLHVCGVDVLKSYKSLMCMYPANGCTFGSLAVLSWASSPVALLTKY